MDKTVQFSIDDKPPINVTLSDEDQNYLQKGCVLTFNVHMGKISGVNVIDKNTKEILHTIPIIG